MRRSTDTFRPAAGAAGEDGGGGMAGTETDDDAGTASPGTALGRTALGRTALGRTARGRAAFDDFVLVGSSSLHRTAYLLTHDHALAEDLVQTALTKTWFAWSRIDGDPRAYARKVLVNTYATWWRRKWNGERPTDELPEPTGSATTTDTADTAATGTDLWTAIGRLPRRQRAVVVLRYFEDLTEAETARVLDCSVGNVKSQTSRALAKLRVDPALIEEQH